MDIILILIIAVVAILLVTFVPGLFNKEDGPKMPGKAKTGLGSGKLTRMVSHFALRRQYKVLGPCRFEKDGQTAEVDCVLIGYFGVLALKSVGRNGEVYGGVNDDEWLQVVKDARIKFENPFNECARAIPLMRDRLEAAKVRGVFLECMPVSTYKKAQLAVPKSAGLLKLSEFSLLLEKQKYMEDKGVDLEKVAAALKPCEIK